MGRYEYDDKTFVRRRRRRRGSPYSNGMCLLLFHPFQGFRCLMFLVGPYLHGISHGRTRRWWKGMRPDRFRRMILFVDGGG